jgi:hypothetical protein
MDAVRYSDDPPWPVAADGLGPSLQRRLVSAYGDDPTNWAAARPNPGSPYGDGSMPVILQQPRNLTVVGSHPAVLAVVAGGGGPFSYQWRFNGDPIDGAVGSVLTIHDSQLSSQGLFDCMVMNDSGAIGSSNALLVVQMPANLLVQPTNVLVWIPPDPRAAPSTNATFVVVASSTNPPLSYQWRKNGAPLTGANDGSLTVSNVRLSDEGIYTCDVTDGIGTITTREARLQPLIHPKFVTSTCYLTVLTNARVNLSGHLVEGHPPPFTYEWRRSAVPVYTNVSRNRSDFFDLVAPGTVANQQLYRLVVKNLANSVPGVALSFYVTTVIDSDGDGMPDYWEQGFGLSSTNGSDRDLDSDGDTMTNWQEYVAGTDPTDAVSYLRVDRLTLTDGARMEFVAVSNLTYTVEFTGNPADTFWNKLADVPAYPTNRVETVDDPDGATNRFYRLVVPRQP